MRKEVVRFVGLAALLLGTVMAWGQQPAGAPAASDKKTEDKPAKSKLEEMLEKALHDNPDVRLADAKLAEAEAELNRARLLVVQKVASAYQAVEAQKAAVDSATAQLEELKKAAASGAVPQADLRAAEQQLIDAKAKLADLESQLPYLMGQQPPGVDDKISAAWTDFRQRRDASPDPVLMRRAYLDLYGRLPTKDELTSGAVPTPMLQGPTADRIRAALDKPFTFEIKEARLGDVILALAKSFEKDNPGLLINLNSLGNMAAENDVGLPGFRFDHVAYGAALEWIEDSMPDCRVVVRDYGVAIALKSHLPPGAPLLHDFWKGTDAEKPATTSGPPAVRFVAEVTSINNAGNRGVELYLRPHTGAKLAPGDVLEVYRIHKENRQQDQYVGSIRVAIVNPDGAIASPLDKADVQPGDLAGVKMGAEDKNPPAKGNPNSLAASAEGKVKEVLVKTDGSPSLVVVSLGLGDGVAKGDMLQVIRQESPNGRALQIGTVRIIRVGEGESTAELVGDFSTPIQVGDKVSRAPKDNPAEKPDAKDDRDSATQSDEPVALAGPPAVIFVAKVMGFNNAGDLGVTLYLRSYSGTKLAPGDFLEVYRIKKENRQQYLYVGALRVAIVTPDGVIARPLDKADVQPGDYAGVKTDADGKDPQAKGNPNPSATPAEGTVNKVLLKADGSPGEVLVSLGLGDGVAKGDMLQVIRQESPVGRALQIGMVRIVQVGEGESRTEPVGKFTTPIREGDKVLRAPKDKPAEKPDAKDQPPGPSAKNVEGLVKDVDKDGRIHIDIGTKDGLAKGDVLTVLRIRQGAEIPLYLPVGRIRVVEVGDCDSVTEPAEKANQAIQPGDKVKVM